MPRQAALALAFVAASATTARVARAELDLKWDAPPNCPTRGEVLERIRALAGTSLDKTEGLSAEGKIAPANGRYYLTLLVRDGHDVRKRVIASDSCGDLTGAAAISLALLLGIDVSAAGLDAGNDSLGETAPKKGASGENVRSEGNERGAESHRPRRPAEPIPIPSQSSAPRRWDLLLRAPILVADLGPLPHPSLGAGLGVGVRYDSWRALLDGRVYLEQTVDADEPGSAFDAGADLRRLTGHLALCRGWRSAQFEIAPCLGLALEYLNARGFGQGVSPESRHAVWTAPNAGATLHWYTLKSLALFVGITGYVELSRPRLVIEGLGEVRQLAPVAAGATIGLEWIL